jgi:hypothetical protein
MKTMARTFPLHSLRRVLAIGTALGCLVAGASAQQVTGKVSCSDTEPATPLANITVLATNLLQGGAVSTGTDANGNYTLSLSVELAVYRISLVNLPAGLSVTSPASGYYEDLIPPGAPYTANFTLTGCAATPTGQIGDRVWKDVNGDGVQDAGEPGKAGVAVQLTDCQGVVLAETTTDAEGLYGFAGLAAGDYALRFLLPPGYLFSPVNAGGDAGLDSDADPATGATACITLGAGETNLTWDAGLYPIDAPGVRSQGYWKNHPDAWPIEEIEIGGVTYEQWEAILIMKLPTKGNKWLNLFEQLVAAKLNVQTGNPADCIDDAILDADLWLEFNPGPVRANSPAWKGEGQYLHAELDDYNNGHLCAPPAE